MLDLTLIIALAALALAILSPIISNLISARHKEKMYRLRYIEQRRQNAIIEYLKASGAVVHNSNWKNTTKYGKAYGEAILYVTESEREEIINLDRLISVFTSENRIKARDQFRVVSQLLAVSFHKKPPPGDR